MLVNQIFKVSVSSRLVQVDGYCDFCGGGGAKCCRRGWPQFYAPECDPHVDGVRGQGHVCTPGRPDDLAQVPFFTVTANHVPEPAKAFHAVGRRGLGRFAPATLHFLDEAVGPLLGFSGEPGQVLPALTFVQLFCEPVETAHVAGTGAYACTRRAALNAADDVEEALELTRAEYSSWFEQAFLAVIHSGYLVAVCSSLLAFGSTWISLGEALLLSILVTLTFGLLKPVGVTALHCMRVFFWQFGSVACINGLVGFAMDDIGAEFRPFLTPMGRRVVPVLLFVGYVALACFNAWTTRRLIF